VGEAVQLGAREVFVLQVGRIERPLTVPPPAVGGGAGGVRDHPAAPVRPRACGAAAVTSLVKYTGCGGYTLRSGTRPNFRGLMT
jgi:hypothetical protein